ncbi:glycosyltransferase-like protein [Blastocystis sp. subtype 4]|uniref:glycosyltransferase-like protein n=1 Tax=Blastocystis sp. subtype 4 TaxID=944170 RepID=UPI0007116DDA|nr:glycosyltransferase-like protein [Blastocystis sp. subtype 4]KNB44776.1 glycosyltransferase-like protein [Blastocystis sp. subtype 4]|eukprot:XP_014528199.1 glycosyltransferase-like protein [Blastocystis sp. subtype 4]
MHTKQLIVNCISILFVVLLVHIIVYIQDSDHWYTNKFGPELTVCKSNCSSLFQRQVRLNAEGVSIITVPRSTPFHLNLNEGDPKQRSEEKRLFQPRSIPTPNGSLPFEVRYKVHKNDRRLRGLIFRKYVNGTAIKWSVFENRTRFEPRELDVSLVIVATEDRLNLDPWIEGWEGPIVVVVYLPAEDESVFTETFRSRGVRSRVTLITAAVTSKSVYYNHFPVNLLRNVGLLNVMTSHVLVVDADMIPAHSLWSDINRIPSSILLNDTSVVLIPIVFIQLHKEQYLDTIADTYKR